MPLNFPASPTINDTYAFGDKTWTWNGSAWLIQSYTLRANAAFDAANTAQVTAAAAFDKANQTAQLAFTTVTANGTSLVADANTDTLTITSAMANGIFVMGTAGTDTLDIGLLDSGVTAAAYGSTSAIPVITVDAKGRLTTVTTAAVDTTTASAAFAHANGAFTAANTAQTTATAAFTAANTKFASAGGTISGDVSVTGNLTIIGQTVYANTSTTLIADNIVTLNAAISQIAAPSVNAGVEVDRGSSANVALLWNETSDTWTFTNDGSTYFDIADAARVTSAFAHANGAFGVANSSTITAQAAFDAANTKFASAGGTISGNVQISGHLTPSSDVTYNIGNTSHRIHTVFVGPGSINIDGITLSNSGGELVMTGGRKITVSGGFDATSHANAAFDKANTAIAIAADYFPTATDWGTISTTSLTSFGETTIRSYDCRNDPAPNNPNGSLLTKDFAFLT